MMELRDTSVGNEWKAESASRKKEQGRGVSEDKGEASDCLIVRWRENTDCIVTHCCSVTSAVHVYHSNWDPAFRD